MMIRHSIISLLFIGIDRFTVNVGGCGHHDLHHTHHGSNNDDQDGGIRSHPRDTGSELKQKTHGNLRRLGIFDNFSEISSSTNPCKDGEPTFTVGNFTYNCQADFQRKGGLCATHALSPEEEAIAEEHFREWKDIKDKKKRHGKDDSEKKGTRQLELGGCWDRDCIDWNTTTITVPTYFHVIHSGSTGKKYTYASNPAYIRNQIKALNIGFRGDVNTAFAPFPGRSYPRYAVTDANTKIQFCLMGTTATDNASWYADQNSGEMKNTLKKGGVETLNVYVNAPPGLLGYATFPPTNYIDAPKDDGVVILNDSMPGGDIGTYNEGDTLTHEVGHWFGLSHTHSNGCMGPGDYMDLAPPSTNYVNITTRESTASFGCNVNLDDCTDDSGKVNPIHNFMSYGDDNCIDQFSPGQAVKAQQAWETYRHKEGYSETISLAADGYSCVYPGMPTSSPTMQPSTKLPTPTPTMSPTTPQSITSITNLPTLAPTSTTKLPTSKPSKTKKPTKPPTPKPTLKPSTARVQ